MHMLTAYTTEHWPERLLVDEGIPVQKLMGDDNFMVINFYDTTVNKH